MHIRLLALASQDRELDRESDQDIQFNDMRMPEHFEVLDLSLDSGVHIGRRYLGAVDELKSDLMARHSMCRHYLYVIFTFPLIIYFVLTFYFAERASTKRALDDILANPRLCARLWCIVTGDALWTVA